METPFIQVKAKDNADALDNLLSQFDDTDRANIMEYLESVFQDVEEVIIHAVQNGTAPLAAYKAFVAKIAAYGPSD